MVRKMAVYSVLAYVLYGLFFYWYLFHFANTSLPFEYQGTEADPATFLSPRELMISQEYSKIKNLLFFLSTPLEWLIYFLILLFGLSKAFKKWAEGSSKNKLFQIAIYLIWLSFFTFLAVFPLSYISYSISKAYHVSTQTFSSWMKDELLDFWLNYVEMLIIVPIVYWLIKKSKKRWWLHAWLLSVPFTIFMMFIQPVVIDPLYNDFYPLKNKELETKILTMADKAHIPAKHVFEVDMSAKTNAMNAYVTGIGSNARIVLWDTTLGKLSDNQILFIMAHEMCHYVEKHIYFGIAAYLLISFFGLYFVSRLTEWAIKHWGREFRVSEIADIRSLPLILMIISMLSFAVSPLTNLMSRYEETRADRYAITMTRNPNAGISAYQELIRTGLSEVKPPLLVKIFRYDHPPMLDRIVMFEEYAAKHKIKLK